MVVENGSKYTPDRHPSWFKVPFLQSQLACCCEWAFFLDSDAYMRMDHHRLSIPTWIQSIKQPRYSVLPASQACVGGVKPQPGATSATLDHHSTALAPFSPSAQFLRQWYSEQQGDYHLFSHVWEQHRLNQVARWPQWRGRVLMVPFRELTGPQGAMVRHLWGGVASEERDRVVYEALEEALGSLQSGQHIRALP
ncbi:unnamed protein product [Closterium sp. NIES-53]